MDDYNMENIQSISYRSSNIHQPEEVCFLYRRFAIPPVSEGGVVGEQNSSFGSWGATPDPYYGEESDFENVYQIVSRCAERYLDYLLEKHWL